MYTNTTIITIVLSMVVMLLTSGHDCQMDDTTSRTLCDQCERIHTRLRKTPQSITVRIKIIKQGRGKRGNVYLLCVVPRRRNQIWRPCCLPFSRFN